MVRKFLLIVLVLTSLSCKENLVYSDFEILNNGSWAIKDTVRFKIIEPDTTARHNMFITVRNDNTFRFSNLFLITQLAFPNGQIQVDTLEYEMASPDGTWLGKGMGSVKENKLWFKENIVFPNNGVYTFKVIHAMRANGQVEGIETLQGITDIGLQIEKSN
ncbi:MAG: gliding motility lipoprotein GldH [Croceitalea sp.]|nr:gliding motility lipoprotein GldH [Croceitalea sp.]MBT8238735.1 gliding motility lipoprotein GldH [Croceitalea sp.]NNC33958.1 gliding motility lipoprotein GldH [Croceitalea sp.]NNL09582.1 gliding motility lipoprotein GldH [Croceitalea sp.]NNM17926.1 gliding motility lipoprotein GldH [Croceitalea sp.]